MTVALTRDPQGAAAGSHDLIVVGGGFHGVMLTLEAARRGLNTLLVERDDFGGATSWNSLRIVHGGLRYLQSFDLRRYRESVAERSWFLRCFPDLVEPLPCLMPLWSPPRGGALRRRSAFRAALAANDLLARERNAGLRADRQLPAGRLLDASETAELFPGVDRGGLRGAALWHDALIPDTPRLLVEALRWACRCGAGVLNYAEVTGLLTGDGGRVTGVEAVDRETGRRLSLRATAVVNCAGPWSRRLAESWDRDLPELFQPVLAFNLLLDCQPPSPVALAVAAPGRGAQTWFLLPWKGLLAGTAYVPAGPKTDFSTGPDEERIAAFLRALNAAVPGLEVGPDRVQRVLWGWLPAAGPSPRSSATPAGRPVIHDHGAAGGPRGLLSVSGVKLTTSRAVAEKVLTRLFAQRGEPLPAPGWIERPAAEPPLSLDEFICLAGRDREAAGAYLRRIVEQESVVRLDDLLLRRTDWGLDSAAPDAPSAAQICEDLGWSADARAPRRAGGGL